MIVKMENLFLVANLDSFSHHERRKNRIKVLFEQLKLLSDGWSVKDAYFSLYDIYPFNRGNFEADIKFLYCNGFVSRSSSNSSGRFKIVYSVSRDKTFIVDEVFN